MTKREQVRIVRELTGSVFEEIRNKIKLGRVPAEWDGHELRCLVADKFEDAASGTTIRMSPRGKMAYNYRTIKNRGNI